MRCEYLSSTQNPKIKAAVRLNERRNRDQEGLFLIEGYRELSRAVQGGVVFHSLFFCPELFLGANEAALIDQIQVPLHQCTEPVFRKLSYRDRPDGLIAVAKSMRHTLHDLTEKEDSFFVLAEAIEKPGNLGTILRSADAAGVDGVIVCDRCTDIYNPNVVRASVGTLFTLPVVEASSCEVFAWLQERKVKVIAATPSAEHEFTKTNLTGPVAIAVGTEQLGLSEFWMNVADVKVKIPMSGVADSLNVATATTLLLYEVVRQRQLSSVLL